MTFYLICRHKRRLIATAGSILQQGRKFVPLPHCRWHFVPIYERDRDSAVGIANDYKLDVSGFDHRRKQKVFPTSVQTGLGSHSASCTMGTGPLPGVKAAEAWL